MQPTCATRAARFLRVPPMLVLLFGVLSVLSACETQPATQVDPPADQADSDQADEVDAPVAPEPEAQPAPAGVQVASPAPGMATHAQVPARFQGPDRFKSIAEACLTLTPELAADLGAMGERAVYEFCEHRSYHSSRHKVIVSRVDGSQLHDRDRPWGWRFYAAGIINGALDPQACEHHAVDDTVPHPRACKKLGSDWPFKRPTLTEELRYQWFAHAHEAEAFGTRGPHDNHMSTAVMYIPGCYPPEMLDRFDFAAEVTILRSVDICETFGCRSKWDIREKWRVGGSRQKALRLQKKTEAARRAAEGE